MLGQRSHGAGTQVGDRADVEHDAACGDLAHQTRILSSSDAVPDPDGGQQIERGPHGCGVAKLARVRHRAEAAVARQRKRGRVRLGRIKRLAAAQADADHAAAEIGERVARGFERCLNGIAAGDLRGQPDLHPVQFAGFLRAVTVTFEHLLPAGAAPYRLSRREDAL